MVSGLPPQSDDGAESRAEAACKNHGSALILSAYLADVAKLVDARDLKSLGRKPLRVRPPPSAPKVSGESACPHVTVSVSLNVFDLFLRVCQLQFRQRS